MLKYIYLTLFILFVLYNNIYAVESARIIILPFNINAKAELSYLQNKIPETIKKSLKNYNAIIIEPNLDLLKIKNIEKEYKSIILKNDSDYIIWGSFSKLGENFSIDVKMAEALSNIAPRIFFVEGKGIENLPESLENLSRDISSKIFKQQIISSIKINGNKRIESEAIKRMIKTKAGDIFVFEKLSNDLKSIYSMGYFDDVRIESEDVDKGKIITFILKEKPTIKVINIKGNKAFNNEEIKELLTIKTGSILNIKQVLTNVSRIENHYKEKNYHNVKINFEIHPLDNSQADLDFIIEEGKKVKIKEITFLGNQDFSKKKLLKIMKTSEKGFFSWMTSSGELNIENLNLDISQLNALYQTYGYIDAKVGDPKVEFKNDWIYITIKIDEGQQFKVGKVNIEGDLILAKDILLDLLKIKKELIFNRKIIQEDIIAITDLYSDQGYAHADIYPSIDKNLEKLTANINFKIDKGKLIYFEKIIIAGNDKTRDKVIRRELPIYEEELYGGQRLKRGIRNLNRLDFFKDVKVDTSKGSSDDKMNLKINVTEKPTGAFSFGGGYSSVESLFATASISQKNLFGKGQILQLKAQVGGVSNQYTLSFTEPWLYDIPLSAGFDLYNWKTSYDTYDKTSVGGGLRTSYPIFDFTRIYLSYVYELDTIDNISVDAPISIKEVEGRNILSSITTSIQYDSRDKILNPTEGSDNSFTVQYAGIGGDIAFTKLLAESGSYYPLFLDTVGFLHAKTGFVTRNVGGILPAYERFYLGGINSLRGFKSQKITPIDAQGYEIGGDKFIQFNVEYLFPLVKSAGLVGLIFYDAGNAFDNGQGINLKNLRESAGFGFRWYSPIGPMRLENGYILDPKEGESTSGRWEFTIGAAF